MGACGRINAVQLQHAVQVHDAEQTLAIITAVARMVQPAPRCASGASARLQCGHVPEPERSGQKGFGDSVEVLQCALCDGHLLLITDEER